MRTQPVVCEVRVFHLSMEDPRDKMLTQQNNDDLITMHSLVFKVLWD